MHGRDPRLIDPLGVLRRLGERRRETLDEHACLQPLGPVGADVASHLAGTQRKPDERRVAQIELGQHLVEVTGERVEVIAHGRSARLPETAPVIADHSIAGVEQNR